MSDTTQLNYMIVDGVLGDFVQEIAAYIDKLDPPSSEDASFEKYTTGLMEDESEANQAKTFLAIAEKSSVLTNAPEKEFESAYNLVLHILTFSPNLTEVLPVLLNNLLSNPPKSVSGPLQVLSVLTNLFNILPTNSPLRYNVFDKILTFAKETNNIHLLVGQLKQLPQWLKDWGVNEQTKRNVFYKVSEILATSSNDPAVSYKYLLQAVSSAGDSEDTTLTSKLVITALLSDFIYDFDEILSLEAVQVLRKSNASLFGLLEIVSSGDFVAYKNLDRSVFNISDDDWLSLEKKLKVLALTSVVYKVTLTERKTISYKEIAEAIGVSEDEVELWVIDTIRAGLVEGRLSQNDQQFDIHRATSVGQFGVEQWNTILNRLNAWKSSLKDVLEVIRNARESAQRENVGRFRHVAA